MFYFNNYVACIFNFDLVRALNWVEISSNFTMFVLYSSNYGWFVQGNALTDYLQLDIN